MGIEYGLSEEQMSIMYSIKDVAKHAPEFFEDYKKFITSIEEELVAANISRGISRIVEVFPNKSLYIINKLKDLDTKAVVVTWGVSCSVGDLDVFISEAIPAIILADMHNMDLNKVFASYSMRSQHGELGLLEIVEDLAKGQNININTEFEMAIA